MRNADLYASVTRKIICSIEAGVADGSYRLPWHNWRQSTGRPTNAVTGRPYSGFNVLALWAAAEAHGYSSGRWATFNQWAAAGAKVRKGAKSTVIAFWKPLPGGKSAAASCTDTGDVLDGSGRGRLLARCFNVFNADQVDGAPALPQLVLTPDDKTQAATQFIGATGIQIRHGGDLAAYIPSIDQVWLPHAAQFRDLTSYYAVLAHEAVHWTGAKHRLHRQFGTRFGDEAYGFEELVAELGSAFLCAHLGLSPEPRSDHAAYIASWLKILKNDPKAILTAASKAQEAADFLASFSSPDAQAPTSPFQPTLDQAA